MSRITNMTVLSTNTLFLEFFFMLLGILVIILCFLEISLRLTGPEFENHKNPFSTTGLYDSPNDRGYVLKYSSSFMETLDFFFVIVPTLLVVFFIVPSMALIFALDPTHNTTGANTFLWIAGHQWYWSYTLMSEFNDPFVDNGTILFENTYDSILDPDSLSHRYQRVDHPVVLPIGTMNCFITSEDVVHSWALPAFSLKVDAVPGRAQAFTITGLVHGVFFGQCSELCGVHHARMPIEVHFVSDVVWFINTINDSLSVEAVSNPLLGFITPTVVGSFLYVSFVIGLPLLVCKRMERDMPEDSRPDLNEEVLTRTESFEFWYDFVDFVTPKWRNIHHNYDPTVHIGNPNYEDFYVWDSWMVPDNRVENKWWFKQYPFLPNQMKREMVVRRRAAILASLDYCDAIDVELKEKVRKNDLFWYWSRMHLPPVVANEALQDTHHQFAIDNPNTCGYHKELYDRRPHFHQLDDYEIYGFYPWQGSLRFLYSAASKEFYVAREEGLTPMGSMHTGGYGASETGTNEVLDSNSDVYMLYYYQSLLSTTTGLVRFFYFWNITRNPVTVLMWSFIVFVVLVALYIQFTFLHASRISPFYMIATTFFLFVYSLVMDYLFKVNGYKYALVHHFLPYFTWLFIFVFYMNLAGLFPFSFSMFSFAYMTLMFAFFNWFGHFCIGLQYKNLDFILVNFNPELPGMMSGFVGLLEIVSILIRPVSLGLRLTANMVGGHIIVHNAIEAHYHFIMSFVEAPSVSEMLGLALTSVPLFVLYAYEITVAFIQSYVFNLLLLIYLREAVVKDLSH